MLPIEEHKRQAAANGWTWRATGAASIRYERGPFVVYVTYDRRGRGTYASRSRYNLRKDIIEFPAPCHGSVLGWLEEPVEATPLPVAKVKIYRFVFRMRTSAPLNGINVLDLFSEEFQISDEVPAKDLVDWVPRSGFGVADGLWLHRIEYKILNSGGQFEWVMA